MITAEQLRSRLFWSKDGVSFFRNNFEHSVLLRPDGTADIDNVASYEKYAIRFAGIQTIEELQDKLRELGEDFSVAS